MVMSSLASLNRRKIPLLSNNIEKKNKKIQVEQYYSNALKIYWLVLNNWRSFTLGLEKRRGTAAHRRSVADENYYLIRHDST